MMHGAITDDQARTLAAHVHTLRPDWDVPGIRAAISKARHVADAHDLGAALIRYARREDIRTPGLFHDDGPHWRASADAAPRVTVTKCPVAGHEHLPAATCGLCRGEWLGGDGWPEGTQHIDAHRFAARAARCKDQLDPRQKAAGEREDVTG